MRKAILNSSPIRQEIVNKEYVDDSEYSLVDGDIVKYAVEYGSTSVPNPNIIESRALGNDLMGDDYFSSAEGKVDVGGDDFYDATGEESDNFADDYMPDERPSFDGQEEEYENFTLIGKEKRAKLNRGLKNIGKNIGKVGKLGLGALQRKGEGAGATAPTLPPPPVEQPRKGWAGLSTGAKIAIVGGGLAVLGTVIFLIVRKKK